MCSKNIDLKRKTWKEHNKTIEECIMRWAKITSGAHETSQKHKQVLLSKKKQYEQCIGTCKIEMCNGILKTNREQDVNNEPAEWIQPSYEH